MAAEECHENSEAGMLLRGLNWRGVTRPGRANLIGKIRLVTQL